MRKSRILNREAWNKLYIGDEVVPNIALWHPSILLSSVVFGLLLALTVHASYGGSGPSTDEITINSPIVNVVRDSSVNVEIPVNNSQSTSNWVFLHLQSYSVNEVNITITPDPFLVLGVVPAQSVSYQALFTIHVAETVSSGTYVADLTLSMRNNVAPPFVLRFVSFSITIVVLNHPATNYDLTFYTIFLSCSTAVEIVLMLYIVSRWMQA